jgi:glycosyltransferase involved in cell wall biosynthesis
MSRRNCPKISIITPSYNQGNYIEQTIQSVLNQDYTNVEHIVIDGGSTDSTVEILLRHPHLIWVSEKDRGQADALNKGLARSTGDIIGWINSDDYYEKNVFKAVVDEFLDPSIMWVVGNIGLNDKHGVPVRFDKSPKITYERLLRNPDIVRQQATFFRRQLIEQAGGWNAEYFMVMDYDLWVRLAKLNEPKMIDRTMAHFRLHSQQKSCLANLQRQTLEICKVLKREDAPRKIIAQVYLKKQWYAVKACCKMAMILLGISAHGLHRRLPKYPDRI